MLELHFTREGRTMLIAQMTDSHLRNTIKLMIRKMQEIRQKCVETPQLGAMEQAMYGIKEIDPEAAGELLRVITQKLYPYLAEAFLRGMGEEDDLLDALRKAIGRSTAVAGGTTNLLPPPNLDDDEFDQWGTTLPMTEQEF